MLGVMITVGGCGKGPVATQPARLTIAVAMPTGGPDRATAEEVVRGVRLAAGDAFAVLEADDAQSGVEDDLARLPEVMGVVAHVGHAAAQRGAPEWARTRLPTVVAAPGEYAVIPRVVPPAVDLALCSAALLPAGSYVVRTDGEPGSLRAAQALEAAVPKGFLGDAAVAPGGVGAEAGALHALAGAGDSPPRVVWFGDPGFGGNLLHALRQVAAPAGAKRAGSDFVAISGYGNAFLKAAGAAAEGALVTGLGGKAFDPAFSDGYQRLYSTAPGASAAMGYDAAQMLIAAWQSAHAASSEVTRSAVLAALSRVSALGAEGTISFDAGGVLRPVPCSAWRVVNGAFVAPDPPVQRPRKPAPKGEWLGLRHPAAADPVVGPATSVTPPGK